jgi:hypothetical protein
MLTPQHTRVLIRIALAAIVLAVLTHTRADPDLFGNVRFGHDIVAGRSAHPAEQYSFTSDRPYMDHEWLFQAGLYLAYRTAGSAGLVAIKLALVAAMLGAVAVALRAAAVSSFAQDLLIGLTVVGTFPQTNQIRAQLCSLALFSGLLIVLDAARRRPGALQWSVLHARNILNILVILIMAIWANVHGGWIVGAGTLAVWNAVGLLAVRDRGQTLIAIAWAAAAVAATLFNPYGWHLWTFLYTKVDYGRVDINDWQPVFRLGLAYGLLWTTVLLAAIAGVAAAARRGTLDWQAVAIVAMFAAASFRVNRLLAFFTLSVVVLMGAHIAALLERRERERPSRLPSRLAMAMAATVALAIVAGGITASAHNVTCIRMEDGTFPEPDVPPLVERYGLHGRMMTWFDYGHYAIWYFSPSIKISMDPRREAAYSSDTIRRQLHFYYAPEDRQAILDELQPDYIWLPRTLDVADRLIEDGWQPLFIGDRSVVLGKTAIHAGGPIRMSTGSRCFPGP